MDRRWVINASPLILLAKVGRLSLLDGLTAELVIPDGVAEEIREGPEDDPARIWLNAEGIGRIQDVGPEPDLIAAWDLGKGESQVLIWAHYHAGYEAIVDDRAARTCALALGLPVRGTLGVILLAKAEGKLAAAGPVFDELRDAGLRIDMAVLDTAPRLAGER